MTPDERDVLGICDLREAITLRDAVMQLVGKFEQHCDEEKVWQDRIEMAMRDMPLLMDNKIAACKQKDQAAVTGAIEHAQEAETVRRIAGRGGKIVAAITAISGTAIAIYEVIVR